jgi:2-oxoglutarate ferredoxin oxidoreductase subunit alpha
MGLHCLATQSYMSRIRGGLNWYDIRVGNHELFAGREKADLLVALSEPAYHALRSHLAEGGLILYAGETAEDEIALDCPRIAKELTDSALPANSVAAGAVYALAGYPVEALCRHLEKVFAKRGPAIITGNLACARRGHELASAQGARIAAPPPRPGNGPTQVYSGAAAIGLAAATAGVKFVTAYPMTPGTGTFTYLAEVADRYGILIEQAEDEIAAINMVCGATYAGVPALTTTSGGGFALMAEGLSLAGMLELPAVVLLAQRPGPATGMPTRTGQQDLQFALRAGHGEFPRAIFAPGCVAQCYHLTRRALATAHQFQTPAIILSDQFLQDLQATIPALDETLRPIDRALVPDPGSGYQRYAVVPGGISPRAIPGGQARVVVDSDEHTEAGHLSESLEVHLAQQEKRMAKLDGMQADFLPPERYGAADAEIVLVAWGSSYGPCREAVDQLQAAGTSAALVHFAQVWPLPPAAVAPLLGHGKRVICVEGNQTGQFAALLRETGILARCELLLRYDGMPFTGEGIVERISA